MKPYSFAKPEHLCRQRDIEALFSAGSHAMTAFPVRLVFRRVPHTAGPPIQVLISVAKRRLHHAVDRNRAKRQLREAYRLNKSVVVEQLAEGEGLHIALIWLADSPLDSAMVSTKVAALLRRLSEKVGCPCIPESEEKA